MASEDQFRHYFPLMRRVIILVAVLTAVPVILWTITVFVRGYFGPPKIPTSKPVATVSAEAPAGPAAGQDASAHPPTAAEQAKTADAPLQIVDARATATDARAISAAAKGPLLGDRQGGDAGPPPGAPSAATVAFATPTGTGQRATPVAAGAVAPAPAAVPPAPDTVPPSAGALATQPTPDAAAAPAADDASPSAMAAEPLPDPVPLPRHRPRYFAMLQSGVPMPRPRPEAAGPTAAEANVGPLDWLQRLLQPQQQ